MQLAQEVLGGKYEFVLTTHIDKGHIHNHLIFNAVSFQDHKHYHSNKRSYHEIRRISDRLCVACGLTLEGQVQVVEQVCTIEPDSHTLDLYIKYMYNIFIVPAFAILYFKIIVERSQKFMTEETIKVFEAGISSIIAILCIILSRYRYAENKKFSEKYAGTLSLIIFRLFLTCSVKGLTLVILLGSLVGKLDTFVALYILTPILIALNLVCFSSEWMKAALTFIKGLYYLGLSPILIFQIYWKTQLEAQDVEKLALGFTLSLAIFECTTALSEGYLKMRSVREAER